MMDMKPVQSTLQKWMRENENFQEHYAKIRREVLNDSEIKAFLAKHPALTKKEIDKNLIKLYEYMTQSKQCAKCTSFETCPNMLPGYSPVLHVEGGEIHLSYEKCYERINYEKQREQQKLVQSLYMPKQILEAKIDYIDSDPKRSQAVREILKFVGDCEQEIPTKGLYLYGPFGVGKTYFLGALANKLKEMYISSALIYMPEFVREMKASMKDDSLNKKLDYFKKTDVLMLDDIGAEMLSPWFRDEILGSLLQYRMMEGLPVFFTSNYSLQELETHLASTRNGVEEVKAGRIIERMKQVSQPVAIFAENRRT